MAHNGIGSRCKNTFGMLLMSACLILAAVSAAKSADDIDHTTSARRDEKCSPCVLILFLYDLNKQWHVIRAATYNSLEACKNEGARVNLDMMREIDKKSRPTTNFYCLREGL
ncbi:MULTISPECIES: hypothetical protein [unclassified Bradyrhizobium]|uniref:hypothetical protein n=1 Tax=unclassified Bradyrhizobium TaxID=2631580 RepID=UPI002916F01E|nr:MULTISPECIES: hypothetical protein [unclassified Bradyrhizobium]